MQLSLAIILFFIVLLHCQEENEGQRRGKRKCSGPKGKLWSFSYENCWKFRCVKAPWDNNPSGAKWKMLGLSPETCCLVDEMAYEVGSVIMMNDTVPLSCENVNGVPSLRIILDNMCPANQTTAMTYPLEPDCPICPTSPTSPPCPSCPTPSPSPTCPSAPPCPTCPTSPSSTPCPTCPTPSPCPACPECPITMSSPFQPELRGGGSSTEGNLFVNGKPVCDDAWDNADASVACRMLGYSTGFRTMVSRYGSVPSDFILDDVACNGDETSLWDCNFIRKENCGPSEGAGMMCDAISLQGGPTAYEGNLFIKGEPVCDDSWDDNDATVACRMLGYEGGFATMRSKYGQVPSEFIMDDVDCSGSQQTLFECSYLPTDNCGSSEGAGVACVSVTLVGGSSSEGNLFINDQPVCDDSWDNNDATVACRMLGFSSGVSTDRSTFGSVPTNFIMDDVACGGDEPNLFQCTYTYLTSHNCGASEGAGVRCQGSRIIVPDNSDEAKNDTAVARMYPPDNLDEAKKDTAVKKMYDSDNSDEAKNDTAAMKMEIRTPAKDKKGKKHQLP